MVPTNDPQMVAEAWRAYLLATQGLPSFAYEIVEPEAWSALCAALDQAGAPLRGRRKKAVSHAS